MKKTFDEAKTWSEPTSIARFYPGYFTINNDRVIQLSNGRILLPAAYTPNVWVIRRLISFCFYSDDNGRTWFRSEGEVSLPKATAEETGLIELKDGRVRCGLEQPWVTSTEPSQMTTERLGVNPNR